VLVFRHPLVREAMKLLGIAGGIEITSVADIPSKGSGLGSSSAFTVGLLHALHAYSGRYASAEQLAKEACDIELNRCGEPIGKQDQFATAFGGFNFIEFNPDDSVFVEPVLCKRETLAKLQENILMFYTGIVRKSSAVLSEQKRNTVDKMEFLRTMRGHASSCGTMASVGQMSGSGSKRKRKNLAILRIVRTMTGLRCSLDIPRKQAKHSTH